MVVVCSGRKYGSRVLVAFCLFVLLIICGAVNSSCALFHPDLDPDEIEALGLEEDEISAAAAAAGLEEDFGEEYDFPSAGEGFEEEAEDDDDGSLSAPDPDVVVLSSANFSSFVASNRLVMVEFYAPWCGHCQALAPEYSRAATELKSHAVVLAKVDATQENELAVLHGVQGYPTMIFFINGKPKPYSHHRHSEAIVSWVRKTIGPAVEVVNSRSDAQVVLESGNTLVVALFDQAQGPEVAAFAAAAQQEDDIIFYQTSNQEVAEVFHIKEGTKAPAVVLIKSEPENIVFYDGKFEESSLLEFVLANKLPLVSKFSRDTATMIFESPIKKQMLLFASVEDVKSVLEAFKRAAKEFKGQIIFVYVDSSDEDIGKPVAEFFGVTVDKPKIVGFTVFNDQPVKYLFDKEATFENIKEFAYDFLGGRAKPFYKSEAIPAKNDGDVKVVVGKNFDEIVLNESKDVLLEIYAPWCGHCQALEPVYNKLATTLRNVASLVIAKMDGTANEHPRGKSDGYPTLLLFPAGNKSNDPIVVDTDRSLKSLYLFLKKHATIPFRISKRTDNEQKSSAEPSEVTETIGSSYATKDEL